MAILAIQLIRPWSAWADDPEKLPEGAYYAPESPTFDATGEAGILSVGGNYWDDHRVACWTEYDSCQQKYILKVGDFWAGRGGSDRYLYPDNYYEDGECGYGTSVGTIPRYSNLYIYAGDGMVSATATSTDTSLKVLLEVWEYQNSSSCSGSYANYYADGWQCCGVDNSAGDQNNYEVFEAYGVGYCTSSDYDGSTCHMPDIILPGFGLTTNTAYRVRIATYVCDDVSMCTNNCTAMVYQDGCFVVSHS